MATKSVNTSRKNVKSTVLMDNSVLTNHYGVIRKYDVLTSEKQKELFKVWKANKGTPEGEKAKTLIIMSNQRFVTSLAKKYANDDNILDLITEANLGFLEGLETYDEEKGANILSWTMNYMRRNILMYIGSVEPLVRNGNAFKTMLLKPKAESKFFQREGRMPSSAELMDEINSLDASFKVVNESDVEDIDYLHIDCTYDQDGTTIPSSSDECLGKYSYDVNDYEETIERDNNRSMVMPLLNSLKPNDRAIIELSFGFNCKSPLTDWEIANKLGKTERYIKTRKAQILKKLDSEYSYDAVCGVTKNK